MAQTPTSAPPSEGTPPVTSDTQAHGAYSTDILSTFPSWAMIFDFQYDSSGFVLGGQYIWKRLPEQATGGGPGAGASMIPSSAETPAEQAERQAFEAAASNYVDLSLLAADAVGLVRAHAHGAYSSSLYDDEDSYVFQNSAWDAYYLVQGDGVPSFSVQWMSEEEFLNYYTASENAGADRYVTRDAMEDVGASAEFNPGHEVAPETYWVETWAAVTRWSGAEEAGLKARFGESGAAPGESVVQTRILDQYGDFLQNLSAYTVQNQSLYKKISYRKLRMRDMSTMKGATATAATSQMISGTGY